MAADSRSVSAGCGMAEPPRDAARRGRGAPVFFYAGVSALSFALYALAVSAAGAPPSVHAAGLVLWVAHVVLLFGRTPSQRTGPEAHRLGELGRPEALDRAANAAAAFSFRGEVERRRRR